MLFCIKGINNSKHFFSRTRCYPFSSLMLFLLGNLNPANPAKNQDLFIACHKNEPTNDPSYDDEDSTHSSDLSHDEDDLGNGGSEIIELEDTPTDNWHWST